MLKIVIRDLEDTKRLAKIVSEGIEDRLVLLLNGDLAAGKTTFTKYLAVSAGASLRLKYLR